MILHLHRSAPFGRFRTQAQSKTRKNKRQRREREILRTHFSKAQAYRAHVKYFWDAVAGLLLIAGFQSTRSCSCFRNNAQSAAVDLLIKFVSRLAELLERPVTSSEVADGCRVFFSQFPNSPHSPASGVHHQELATRGACNCEQGSRPSERQLQSKSPAAHQLGLLMVSLARVSQVIP